MIDIKNIAGNVILSTIITQDAERVEELMKSDYVQLSWSSDENITIPVGAYIEHGGEKFSLLEPYSPEQRDELEYEYKPQFQSRIMAWGKTPLFLYTTTESGESKETDWTLTDNPANFMAYVCKAILKETGEAWTYTVDSDLAASGTLSFSTVDIYSALSAIANEFETEWWADKANNIIHLGKCQHGNAVTLQVGNNIKAPSVTRNKEGYFTRFYAFGSTRNITQDYEGANANNIVNKRLTLDPTKYPEGYKDIRNGLQEGEIFSKVLIFDDIYPSSKLSISNVRVRLLYRIDNDGNKIQVGTDSDGNPIYDQYAIWYFRIPDFTFDKDNIIEGLTLSVSFQTGALAGREFELTYHDKDKSISTSDGQPFNVLAGDYEINFIEEGTYIIPAITGLVPTDGDEIVLFNIVMPEEYKQSAYDELEEALDKEIERMGSDLNAYQFESDPYAFYYSNPNLTLGQKVLYVNGDYSYETRVMKLVTKLDYDCEQVITIGNQKIKGNTEQIKEEVVNANTNIDLLAILNETTNSLAQAYQRTQKMILEGFASIKDMWKFDEEDPQTIYSKFNVYSTGYLSALGNNPESGSEPAGATTLGGLTNVADDADSIFGVDKVLVLGANNSSWTLRNLSEMVGLDEEALLAYLTKNNYAKKSDIPTVPTNVSAFTNDANYATTKDLDSRINDLINGAPAAYDTLKEIADVLEDNVDSIGDILDALGNKADKATTLSGYGITDAYTISQTDSLLGVIRGNISTNTTNIANLTSKFDKMFTLEGSEADGYVIKANYSFYSSGFLSALGLNPDAGSDAGGAANLDELEDVEFGVLSKGDALVWNGSYWTNQSIESGLDTDELYNYLTTNKYATQQWVSDQSYLKGITSAMVTTALGYTPYNAANFTKANIKSTLGISDWALAASKPSYKFSEITSKPTTLSGYGITDAKIASGVITLGGNTITPLTSHQTIYNLTMQAGTFSAVTFDPNGAAKTVNIPTTTSHISEGTNLYFTNARAVSALKTTTDGLSDSISTLQGYFTNGVAKSAAKLTTVSKTAWGKTYWTSGGVPTSISGDMSSVGSISMSGAISGATNITGSGTLTISKIVIGSGAIEWDSSVDAFKVTGGLYTDSFLSALGLNPDAGSDVGGATNLDELEDVDLGTLSKGDSLVWNGSYWTNQVVSGGFDEDALDEYLSTNNYAKKSDISSALGSYQPLITSTNKLAYSLISGTPTSLKNPYSLTFGSKSYNGSSSQTINASDLGALTSHQTIYSLTIKNSAGTTQLTYTPNSKAGSITLTKAMVGLGNVENTALSSWKGSSNITTLGTITSGTWNGSKIANAYLANSSITIAGTSVSLGGSITAATLKTNLGLGSAAYKDASGTWGISITGNAATATTATNATNATNADKVDGYNIVVGSAGTDSNTIYFVT